MSDFAYTYAQPSAREARPEGQQLSLAAYAENAPSGAVPAGGGAACFFRGRLCDSWLAARGPATLAKVVAARFVPLGAALRDPIVSAGAGQLRFEAFSGCNGVYARLDLGPAALDGEFLNSGTTNVAYADLHGRLREWQAVPSPEKSAATLLSCAALV